MLEPTAPTIYLTMKPVRFPFVPEADKLISPFASSEVELSGSKKNGARLFLIVGLGLLLVIGGGISGFLGFRYLDDPYRTLESFPVSKYFDNYQGLSGSKFKAEFSVEADLGWKDGTGRLMLFSTAEDSRPIAVLIPAAVANGIYFTKGQTYMTEVEVKEGGLIYANSCQKN